ncbi:GMC family oxidoreductase N-terminal domain-containing protein, partial [Enterococcus entomosocium]|uniref:GMC family oxidoreductase N-terminal domain-containing protein n=1 Tax=Enterococcus entomosocium TaxID=3034352 RepID=UPI0026484A18
ESAMPSSVKNFIQASHEVGYPFGDANGPQTPSVNYLDFSQDERGRRVSSYSSYIRPLLRQGRSNLVVLVNTVAKRVIFKGNRAVGVTYQSNDKSVGFARARKEIIVSAGVVDSAAILMRSGIGTEDVLKKANV